VRAVRGGAVVAAATILLLFSMAIPWQPLFQLAIGLYALVALCLLWIANNLWGLRFHRPAPVKRGQVGQVIHDPFELTNTSVLPKVGIEILDHSTVARRHRRSALVYIPPRHVEPGDLDTVSELRGLFTLGPTGAVATDPFGLFSLQWHIGPPSEVLVYPETVDLASFSVPGTLITEGSRHRRRTQMETPDPAGTRAYAYGDSMRRIHWPSTAHAGQLMVKEYEFTPAADIWVFVDLDRKVHVGSGVHSTEEYAVTAAASIAAHYLKAGRSVGLMCSSRSREVLLPDRGTRQLVRMLETLAVVRANGHASLQEMLLVERTRMHRSATAVVVTPSVDEGWAGVLAQLQHGGTHTAVLLVEPSTFASGPAATMQVAALTSTGIPTYLIKRSATIRQAIREGLSVGVNP
jgi:uncharacterized protein (DUF58 family)